MDLKQSLPMPVLQVLSSDAWCGGDLLQLKDETSRPTAEEVVLNFAWLRPVCQQFKSTVPSGYFCTDLFLALDDLFLQRLIHPTAEKGKKALAAIEGYRMKRLMGAVRFLWRSSILDLSHP